MLITMVADTSTSKSENFANGVPKTYLLTNLSQQEVLERIGFLQLVR